MMTSPRACIAAVNMKLSSHHRHGIGTAFLLTDTDPVQSGYRTSIQASVTAIRTQGFFKYAFPSSFQKQGVIRIEPKNKEPDQVAFVVQNNGIGLPKSIDIRKTESPGLHLVYLPVKEQLNGSLRLERRNVTKFVFHFHPSQSSFVWNWLLF